MNMTNQRIASAGSFRRRRLAHGFTLVAGWRRVTRFVAVLALVAVPLSFASTVQAGAVVGFQIASITGVGPLFLYENNITLGTNGPHRVDLSVDLSDLGMGTVMYEDASIHFFGTLQAIERSTSGSTELFALTFDGTLKFVDDGVGGSGDAIISVDFADAILTTLGDLSNPGVALAGGLVADNAGMFTTVDYTAGPALGIAPMSFQGAAQFGFTVENMSDLLGGAVDVADLGGGSYSFEDFTFSSSFSGSAAAVPEPSAVLFAIFGGVGLLGAGLYLRKS